jgi:hypothetical protein
MARALVKDASNMRRKVNVCEEALRKQLFAIVDGRVGKGRAFRRELHDAPLDVCEPQHLQGFSNGKKLIDLHMQHRSDRGQIGDAVIGGRGDGFDQARKRICRNLRQNGADADAGKALGAGVHKSSQQLSQIHTRWG